MKRYVLLWLFLIIGSIQSTYGQDFNTKFNDLFDKNDVVGQQKILQRWEKNKPDDPELFVAFYNYYFNKSRKETLSLTSRPVSKESIVLTKEKDEKAVSYLGSQYSYNKEDFDKSLSYIDKGIEKFPNRLDMRFGKIYALGQVEDYKTFTSEIIKTLDYSNTNKNQWFWMESKPVKETQKFMLNAVQDYVGQLYDAGDDYADNIKIIAETVLKYYPDNVENLSNLAISYLIRKDFDNALIPLLKAEKIAPTDFVVLNNIALCYYSKDDKINAVKYYELVTKYGSEEAQLQAKEKLNELKRKN
jgi:tetratricopeptide (TPR) repeat protein